MIITKSKDKKKQQEVALSKENPVLSEKEKMLFEEEKILSEEEMKACKNRLLEREKKTNKEVIDFLKQYINNGNNGIIPQNFKKNAHLGENTFRKVFSQKRNLSKRFKQRICLGIGIMWKDIVQNHIDRFCPKLDPEERQKKVQKLQKEFIWHLGTPMKEIFEMMQEGENLEHYAIYMNKTSGNKDNFTKNV
uniref:hypothetical protein n=1 Tax=Segatella copri TaxID=165179 RepID=UPI00263A0464|nr:hypothetical protein [uncultured Prevotella sp.]